MKKRNLFLKILVALVVLSSILVSAFLGVTKAEYFKILSKEVGFEAYPDLSLEYYLYDADGQASANFSDEYGSYKDSKKFVQHIRPGKAAQYTIGSTTKYNGSKIVYQVKIPVDETGYYTLDFLTYTLLGTPNESGTYGTTEYATLSYMYCVGCEVATSSDTDVVFGSNTKVGLEHRIFANSNTLRKTCTEETVLYSDLSITNDYATNDSVYQWKTLNPSMAENVKLTFKVEQADVTRGYVIWMWDFAGLEGGYNYTLHVENLNINKTMNLDGTTANRDSTDPYFMFPQTAYYNNITNKETNQDDLGNGYYPGANRYSSGRGTFVTEATESSLGMRAEMLYDLSTGTKKDSNTLALYIPLKNVKIGSKYKVTFDFSIARQGSAGPDKTKVNGWNGDTNQGDSNSPAKYTVDWHKYNNGFEKIFRADVEFSDSYGIFQSYLMSNLNSDSAKRSKPGHTSKLGQIKYSDKYYENNPLVKYDEVVKYNSKYLGDAVTKFPNYSTSDNINDTYSKELLNGTYNGISLKPTHTRNFFNAVQHTEYNGQYEINWITFYNTTFSFNISECADLDDLYWVWAIDVLHFTAFYNIRIDNVRIEEVVEYSSEIFNGGLKIAGEKIGTQYMCHYGQTTSGGIDTSPFNNFRGWNGTGENYQARDYAETQSMPKGNIYAPIFDASQIKVGVGDSKYLIELSGRVAAKGGIEKYVYSIDGGITWEDMTFTGGDVSSYHLSELEKGIDLSVQGQSTISGDKYIDRITYTKMDGYNGNFDDDDNGWKLSVNLEKYKHIANLDIIIAAVPNDNHDAHLEILRIVNFNQIRNYRTYTNSIASDIISGATGKEIRAYANGGGSTAQTHQNVYQFYRFRGCLASNGTPNSGGGGYARRTSYSYAYEDIITLYSDMPVKTKLKVAGFVIIEGGTDEYVWSPDNGKTWISCEQSTTFSTEDKDKVTVGEQRNWWYDGNSANDTTLEHNNYFYRTDSSGNLSAYIAADLSNYVGEVVDVIFAAKPIGSDVYCPIAKVDNVAVYGETGTFYTQINSVYFNGAMNYSTDSTYGKAVNGTKIEPTYFDVEGQSLNKVTSGGSVAPQWNLGYSATDGKQFSYTIFEPYNVDVWNARLYNDKYNSINSGGQICIDGYTVSKTASGTGALTYKYTLDGGETWNVIYKKTTADALGDGEQTNAKHSDASFTQFGADSRYSELNGTADGRLTFNIPAYPDGTKKTLTVVAEDSDKDIIPVLNIKIEVKNNYVGAFTYDNLHPGDIGNFSPYNGDYTMTKFFKPGIEGGNSFTKLTLPVSQEGVHTLSFDVDRSVTKTRTNADVYYAVGTVITKTGTVNTIQMSVEKTDFVENESIYVSYYLANSTEFELTDPVIAIARVEDDGSVRLYEERDSSNKDAGKWAHYERAAYIVDNRPTNVNEYTSNFTTKKGVIDLRNAKTETELTNQSRNTVLGLEPNLPAGKYRIYFFNDETIRFGNIALNTFHSSNNATGWGYGMLQLTDPIDITIHPAGTIESELSAYVVHDNGVDANGNKTLFYASTEKLGYDSTDARVDKSAKWKTNDAHAKQNVELYFNATAEDVERGYVVLCFDYGELDPTREYALNINKLSYGYGVRSTQTLTANASGNVTHTLRLPAVKAGTYEYVFSSATTLSTPVTHRGLNHSTDYAIKNTNEAFKKGGDYGSAGAFMSVEKTVFNVGEPIHVSFSSAGCVSDNTQAPWIGITRAVDGRDVYLGYVYVGKNVSGTVTLKGNMGNHQEGYEHLAHLPEGDYKIYFRDCSSNIYRSTVNTVDNNQGDDWPEMNFTDPIAIKIVDPNKVNDTNKYKYTYYFDDVHYRSGSATGLASSASGWISFEKTVFYKGEDINFDYSFSERTGNANINSSIWLGIRTPNNDIAGSQLKYVYTSGIGTYSGCLTTSDLTNLAPGQYQLVLTDNNFAAARKQGSIMAVVDITILPEDARDTPTKVVLDYRNGNADDLSLNLKESTSSAPISAYPHNKTTITVTVTKQDVTRGYVEFDYNLSNIEANSTIVYTTEMFYDRPEDEKPYEVVGNIIYFGEYPQSLKSPSVTVDETKVDERGYFKGDDGYYYAKVVANPYGNDYYFSNGTNSVVNGTAYYFKVEPIRWRIVQEDEESMTIICENIIANQHFDAVENNYEGSDIRAWLNDQFYKVAFNDIQKVLIKSVLVDNSAASTGYAINPYACGDTNDKIFLPSYADVTNSSYGFNSDADRTKAVTDYAIATGAWTNMSQWDGATGSGIWMLRSPADSPSNRFIRECYYLGDITDGGIDISITAHGVVPMLTLSTVQYEDKNTIVEKQAGNSSTYRFNYSAWVNTKQDASSIFAAHNGSSMSVPKTYFAEGEPIPVTYTYNTTWSWTKAWIGIASADAADGKLCEYAPITFTEFNKGTSGTIEDIRSGENLEPGEYKIWFIYGDGGSNFWKSTNSANHRNPFKEEYTVTDPICIKIIDKENPDYSLTYKTLVGDTYSYIKLKKNVFKQGENIEMAYNGFTNGMYAWLHNANNEELISTWSKTSTLIGSTEVLNGWTGYYSMNGVASLAPGKYKLYYANYGGVSDVNAVYKTHGNIVAIIDITILPAETADIPTSKLDVIYTNTSGSVTRQSIDSAILLNGLLNNNPANENLEYNANGEIISNVLGIVQLTDVQPNSTIQFVFTHPGNLEIEPTIDEVNLDYEIKKGAIDVTGYKFAATTYDNVYISVPKTYYIEGEDITVTFNTIGIANPRILLTTDSIGTAGQYNDVWVRATSVQKLNGGTVNISDKTFDKSASVSQGWIESNTKWNVDDLPPGEYKIWLFDTSNINYAGTTCEMYRADAEHLVTEPISIKILPKDDITPDFSITHYSDWQYLGSKKTDGGENWTSLTLDKTVFKQGEKIRYYIDGSWEHKWVGVFSADTYSMDSEKVENYPGKDKTWRYVQWGHKDYISKGLNYLETETLPPGQYKIVYVFGLTLDSAWAYQPANYNEHAETRQKIMTVIDITIVE